MISAAVAANKPHPMNAPFQRTAFSAAALHGTLPIRRTVHDDAHYDACQIGRRLALQA